MTQFELDKFGDWCFARGFDFSEKAEDSLRHNKRLHRVGFQGQNAQNVRQIIELWEDYKHEPHPQNP